MSAIAETPATELGAMIVNTPGILGGKPRIKGHRIAVHRVAGWWKLGLTIEEIASDCPRWLRPKSTRHWLITICTGKK
jgi:uncharacterized protein (DUF433 family)